MVEINIEAARAFAIEAVAQIRAGAVEDVLRHLLSARLPLMFPENPWWIQEHSIGAETHVHFIDAAGKRRTGFIDSLVGKTAIEYEKNLNVRSVERRKPVTACDGMQKPFYEEARQHNSIYDAYKLHKRQKKT